MELNPVDLGPLHLEIPIYNGAGTVKTTEQVRKMAESNAGAVTLGSITIPHRGGNEGDTFWIWDGDSINSLGIPNPGRDYYKKEIPVMARICHDFGKQLVVNIQGNTPEEFGTLAEMSKEAGADAEEPNLACPNLWKDGKQKGIFGFYPEMIAEIFHEIERRVGKQKRYLAKVPDYSNPQQLQDVATLMRQGLEGFLAAIVCCNTHANAFVVRRKKGKPPRRAITFGKGYGGYAGSGYKPIALGQCVQWHEMLAGSGIQLVGAGGIGSGEDAADYFQFAHVDAIQVVTGLFRNYELHPPVFHRIIDELLDVPDLTV